MSITENLLIPYRGSFYTDGFTIDVTNYNKLVIYLTIEDFLTELDRKQSEIPDKYWNLLTELDKKVREIVLHINKISQKPTPYDGGSKKKGTMIKEAFDLDVLFYYPSDTEETLEILFETVKKYLASSFHNVYPKNVAIRIDPTKEELKSLGINVDEKQLENFGFHIDVIVAKRIAKSENEVNIYRSRDKKYLKSSVELHLEAVSEFKRRDIIRLLKVWKIRNLCECPGFILENIAIESLKDEDRNKLDKSDALKYVFEYIRDKFPKRKKISDPANPNHNLLDDDEISEEERQSLIQIATNTLNLKLDTISGWEEAFKKKGLSKAATPVLQRTGKIQPDAPNTHRFG